MSDVDKLYQKALELLLKKIESKTSWGKVEIKNLILECILEAGKSV
jgi:hypothetical protein